MDVKKILNGLRSLGYTQQEISDLTGITQSQISRILNGTVKQPRLNPEQWERLEGLIRP